MIVVDVVSCVDMEQLSGYVLVCVVLISGVFSDDDIGGVWGVINEDNDVISGVDMEQFSGVVQDVFVCVVLTPEVVCDSDNDENGAWGVVNEDNDSTVSLVVTFLVAFP